MLFSLCFPFFVLFYLAQIPVSSCSANSCPFCANSSPFPFYNSCTFRVQELLRIFVFSQLWVSFCVCCRFPFFPFPVDFLFLFLCFWLMFFSPAKSVGFCFWSIVYFFFLILEILFVSIFCPLVCFHFLSIGLFSFFSIFVLISL